MTCNCPRCVFDKTIDEIAKKAVEIANDRVKAIQSRPDLASNMLGGPVRRPNTIPFDRFLLDILLGELGPPKEPESSSDFFARRKLFLSELGQIMTELGEKHGVKNVVMQITNIEDNLKAKVQTVPELTEQEQDKLKVEKHLSMSDAPKKRPKK